MITNFYPIEFEFDDYQVGRVKVQEGLLDSLRANHNHTHSFFRHGDFIYLSNKCGDELNIGETYTASILEDKLITSSLIKHIYFRTFLESYPKYKPSSFYPFVLQAAKKTNDLIYTHLPEGLKGRLRYIKQIELQVRSCKLNDSNRLGFTLNVVRRWKNDVSCLELNQKKFDLVGFEVMHSHTLPRLSGILLPDETLIGAIKEIEDNFAIVETNLGEQKYALNELYLRNSHRNLRAFLSFALRSTRKAEAILENLSVEKRKAFKSQSVLSELEKAKKILFNDKQGHPFLFQNKDGFCFKVNQNPNATYSGFRLDNPTFVFDPSRVRTSLNPDAGLTNNGPFDSTWFNPKEPRILVICHKTVRGRASQFAKGLVDGIPSSKYFSKGFRAKYEFFDTSLDFEELNDYSIDEVKRITKHLDSNNKPDIVIVEMPKSFRQNKDVRTSFYHHLKSHFLGLEIPIQIVNTETINNFNEYQLNSIGLQMYAKLGGVPWTILNKESYDREIVVGIGNSHFRNNAYSGNARVRIVGIATFFSGDGQYLMTNKVKDVPYDEYFDELLRSLKESINDLEKEYAWRENDTVRLIFHIFKPIKNVEFEVVKSLVKSYTRYHIQFAFVTISEFHPFLMFDENQGGIQKFGKTIGEMVPNRGTNIVLDESSCLVQMLGIKEMKTNKHGASPPLLVRIWKPNKLEDEDEDVNDLLFTDLHYVVQQIYKFSYLSWRSFMPNQKPATMLYSSLISKILGQLRKLPDWNPSSINFKLKFTKWFL